VEIVSASFTYEGKMKLSDLTGFSTKKIRYGIVALGSISQEAMLPGIGHTGNSEVTALVTGDPVKPRNFRKCTT
jgi:hypothetical protein